MHVLLAGASGVVGRRVLPLLVAEGHRVTALTRHADRADALRTRGAEPVVADVFDAEALTRIVGAAAPDVVMHQLTDLGAGDRTANNRIRRVGTRALVDAAKAAGIRRIVAQSIAWAYAPGEEPADERTPLDLGAAGSRRTTIEGVAALEAAVAELPDWVVLRYGLFHGPDTWYAPGGPIAAQAVAGSLVADADVVSFVHVDDAAWAAVDALTWPTGPVNVCDDEPAAGTDWVPAFCAGLGVPAPEPDRDTARHPWARGASNQHARKTLGWTPGHPSWREDLGRL